MENLFVPYELALKLKDKGFDKFCIAYYYSDLGGKKSLSVVDGEYDNHNSFKAMVSAPLYQQAIDWLRGEKGIQVFVHNKRWSLVGYNADIWYKKESFQTLMYDSYYSALQSGIEKALDII